MDFDMLLPARSTREEVEQDKFRRDRVCTAPRLAIYQFTFFLEGRLSKQR